MFGASQLSTRRTAASLWLCCILHMMANIYGNGRYTYLLTLTRDQKWFEPCHKSSHVNATKGLPDKPEKLCIGWTEQI